jgi:AraC-like DNA-binding protein
MGSERFWKGRLFLGAGMVLYIGPGAAAERHAHHAVQLVWSRDEEFTLTLAEAQRRRAALIPADVPHALDASGSAIALLLVEAYGSRGVALDRRARRELGAEVARELSVIAFPMDLPADGVSGWCDSVLVALGVSTTAPPPLSSVSRRAIAYVEATIEGTPRLTEAAGRLGMSPTRLTHVFSREVGIPFRRFVLWTRIKHAVSTTRAGANLTAAAVAAGFSDAAHFSRTFRGMFGLSPSRVLPVAEILATQWDPPP